MILSICPPHMYACITLFKFNSSVRSAAVSEATSMNDCCSCQVQAWIKRSWAGERIKLWLSCLHSHTEHGLSIHLSVSSHTPSRQVRSWMLETIQWRSLRAPTPCLRFKKSSPSNPPSSPCISEMICVEISMQNGMGTVSLETGVGQIGEYLNPWTVSEIFMLNWNIFFLPTLTLGDEGRSLWALSTYTESRQEKKKIHIHLPASPPDLRPFVPAAVKVVGFFKTFSRLHFCYSPWEASNLFLYIRHPSSSDFLIKCAKQSIIHLGPTFPLECAMAVI